MIQFLWCPGSRTNTEMGKNTKPGCAKNQEASTLLNSSLSPLQTSLESIHSTLASHTTTISEMETALTDHSGRITELEIEVNSLKAKLTAAADLKATLGSAVDDLVSRSKRQNLRVVGFPEGIEGRKPREFITDFFFKSAKDVLSAPPEIDHAHRSLVPKPRQGDRPRPFIVRFHRFLDKDTVLRWAKEHKEISYQGHTIKIYKDFSVGIARKRAAFNSVKSSLYKKGIRFEMAGLNTGLSSRGFSVKLVSWNVRGLGGPIKRSRVFSHLKN
uniref:L1 transposable element RRM domain-containing protein n=1 Tax=Sinocyclocheilus anshuiensis TaxID=1608454 RepID=A0A671L470_9TELE